MALIHPDKNSLELSLKDRVTENNDSIEIMKRTELDQDRYTNKLVNLETVQPIRKKKDLKKAKERISQLLSQSTAHGIPNMLRANSFFF